MKRRLQIQLQGQTIEVYHMKTFMMKRRFQTADKEKIADSIAGHNEYL